MHQVVCGWRLCALFVLASCCFATTVTGQATFQLNRDGLPAWARHVGARKSPTARRIFSANAFGAVADGVTNSTAAIQKAIDACAEKGGGIVDFKSGAYVTGAIFLKSNVHLRLAESVTLLGSQEDHDYPSLWTRVAGIEMNWPAALINVNGQKNVRISGGGTIDGRGEKWWTRYWKLRRDDYEPRGLRWASDHDAQRVRLMVVWKSSDVTIGNPVEAPWFLTVQIVYSDHVTVDGAKISDNKGPSTDGVDIDSSDHVLVQNCDIDNNDDDICLKAGRDYDGRVNRPTEYIVFDETLSGRAVGYCPRKRDWGIRQVAYDNVGIGTNEGIRFKSLERARLCKRCADSRPETDQRSATLHVHAELESEL